MTINDAREATKEAAAAATPVADHLERLTLRLSDHFPLDGHQLSQWSDDPRERLHAFLRLFEQRFDLTSRKIFRGVLTLSGETISNLSLQNQFRRMEALGAIDSAERWIAIGSTRNILVHDYPTNAEAQARRANLAWDDAPDLIAFTRSAVAWLSAQGYLA